MGDHDHHGAAEAQRTEGTAVGRRPLASPPRIARADRYLSPIRAVSVSTRGQCHEPAGYLRASPCLRFFVVEFFSVPPTILLAS
jgi:hypothetical protein